MGPDLCDEQYCDDCRACPDEPGDEGWKSIGVVDEKLNFPEDGGVLLSGFG